MWEGVRKDGYQCEKCGAVTVAQGFFDRRCKHCGEAGMVACDAIEPELPVAQRSRRVKALLKRS